MREGDHDPQENTQMYDDWIHTSKRFFATLFYIPIYIIILYFEWTATEKNKPQKIPKNVIEEKIVLDLTIKDEKI